MPVIGTKPAVDDLTEGDVFGVLAADAGNTIGIEGRACGPTADPTGYGRTPPTTSSPSPVPA